MRSKDPLSREARSVADSQVQAITPLSEIESGPVGFAPKEPSAIPRIASTDIGQEILAWCAGHRTPAAMVRRDGGLIWANDAATAFLNDRNHFGVRGDKLVPVDPIQANDFREFLERDGVGPTTWIGQEESGNLVVVMEVIPGENGVRGLSFHRGGADATYFWANFGPVLGLTGSEARIAQKLVDGNRAGRIADDIGIGLETVRTHVRRIYNKLGINSREELFSRLSEFRLR